MLGSIGAAILSLFGCGHASPPQPNSAESQSTTKTIMSDLSDSDLQELTRMLPDFIDSVQHRESGNDEQAALSTLAALPLGGNPEVMNRNANRILWATTVHGLDRIKETALLARDSEDAVTRKAKSEELANLLRIDDVDERANAILEKLQHGQTPTSQEFAILKLAAELMGAESPTTQGE
jgi:hypothetical protein